MLYLRFEWVQNVPEQSFQVHKGGDLEVAVKVK